MLTYEALQLTKYRYDPKGVTRNVLVCQKSADLDTRQQHKLILFEMMGSIVTKNIDNFFYLTRHHSKEIFHSKDDLVGESYIVFEGCLKNFDFKRGGNTFLWYLNKALTRAMLRIIDKCYNKHLEVDTIGDKDGAVFNGSINNVDFTGMYMDNLGITDPERRIIQSKIEKEKVADFLENNPDITWNQYFKHLNVVKEKLTPLRYE